jgi:hypothetical protein
VRFTTSYFLFVLYVIAVFGQLIPIASDFISHSFSEAIHIATVHAKYGSNHLGREIENTTRDNTNNHSSKITENFDVHLLSEQYHHDVHGMVHSSDFHSLKSPDAEIIFLNKVSQPPKVS